MPTKGRKRPLRGLYQKRPFIIQLRSWEGKGLRGPFFSLFSRFFFYVSETPGGCLFWNIIISVTPGVLRASFTDTNQGER